MMECGGKLGVCIYTEIRRVGVGMGLSEILKIEDRGRCGTVVFREF